MDRFVANDSTDAYEELVDELLARKSFGERMASDWLDVARYSDSYGYQVDRDRFVWPWRDWVIRAINANLPYNEFITWQLAGDLFPEPSREQFLATTFNRLHPQKVEGGSVPEEFRVEYVADRTRTFGTALLGLTLECARCHDHKYDPISQKEYYQLFAFFNNIDEAGLYSYFTNSVPTPTLFLNSQEQQAQLDQLNRDVEVLEREAKQLLESRTAQFDQWLQTRVVDETIPGQVAYHAFEDYKGNNKQIDGKVGKGRAANRRRRNQFKSWQFQTNGAIQYRPVDEDS